MQNDKPNFRSPIIKQIDSAQERLVDTGLLHYEASIAGYNERYHRGETSHTIHVWWARRPHSAMRSLVFSSVCKNKSVEASNIMANLAMSCDAISLAIARNMVREGYQSPPKVLDMFGGGGTIPFEIKRLGLDSYSIDSNQLSVFIQKCNMEYADKVDLLRAAELVNNTGCDILQRIKKKTNWLYPLRLNSNKKVFGYIWSYKTYCPDCNHGIVLSKRPWLSRKKDKRIGFISASSDHSSSDVLSIKENCDEDDIFVPHWESRTGIVKCPSCGKTISDINVMECEDLLLACVESQNRKGKVYTIADQELAIPSIAEIEEEEKKILAKLEEQLPESELPVWSGIVNPALYGIKTHSDFLNRRQRLLLLYLIEELIAKFNVLQKESEDMARFVIGSLSSLIDQVVDWNCRLSMWISQNEQVGRGFCGPGIAMLFDYAETDQLLDGPANLWDKLKRICSGVMSFENCQGFASVSHAHAQELPFDCNYFDAIVTDPPYYDNIYYSILADFFYAWKKILLKKVVPELFEKKITDYEHELVASSRRVDETTNAHEAYCTQLNKAFKEACRVLKADGVFSFVYAHSSINGWEAVVRAYRQSDFFVSSVQPLSIERKGRPRAVLSQAVNTCMAFIARKSSETKKKISLEEILDKTKAYCVDFGKQLEEYSGWCQADAGMAVIACTIGLLANSSGLEEGVKDTDAIRESAKLVKHYFPEFSIKMRDSL